MTGRIDATASGKVPCLYSAGLAIEARTEHCRILTCVNYFSLFSVNCHTGKEIL